MGFARFAIVLAAPLLLASCLLTPGAFVSTLDIKRDRSFTFTYVGEVILTDPSEAMAVTTPPEGEEDEAAAAPVPARPKPETQETIAKRRAVADALSKERGYRSVDYLGKGRFRVDYALSGTLDRSFVFPFNSDAEVIFPWIAIEVRSDGTARIKAPAFGDGGEQTALPTPATPMDEVAEARQGTFTFTTDAELIMQNNEEGLAPGPGTKVVWHVTPASKTVPTAVVRFAH